MFRKRHASDDDFKEMELWEHLAELRARLIRSLVYVALSLVVAWCVYPWLYQLFFAPLQPVLAANKEWKVFYPTITAGFSLRFQVSLIAGLVLAIPLVTLEAWGFVAPGLTRNERRVAYVIVPLSLCFFFMGVACGYAVMRPSVQWFATFIPKDQLLLQNPIDFILFMVKMVVAFGVCFQMPVVLMFLTWVGMIGSDFLKRQWRIAVVVAFVLGAVATPGGDPFSMMLLAAPLAVLYLGSIALCTMVERLKLRAERKEEGRGPGRLAAESAE